MLSAATAALVAAPVFAATTITTGVSTKQQTSTTGDLVISQSGAVAISIAGTPAVELNSDNFVLNQGNIANTGVNGAIDRQSRRGDQRFFQPRQYHFERRR
jgi:hypothetical protein